MTEKETVKKKKTSSSSSSKSSTTKKTQAKKKTAKKPNKKTVKKTTKKDIKKKNAKLDIDKKQDNGETTAMALNAVTFILNTVLTILFYVIVVIAIIKACESVYNFGYQIYGNVSVESAPGHTVNLFIDDGETTMNVASKLEEYNVIENKYTFYIRTKLSGKSIYPGTYQVNSSWNYKQILDEIADYDTALENLEEDTQNSK